MLVKGVPGIDCTRTGGIKQFYPFKLSISNATTCMSIILGPNPFVDSFQYKGSFDTQPTSKTEESHLQPRYQTFERRSRLFNSLAPGRFERNLRKVIFKLILMIGGWSIFCKIALRWMSVGFTDDKSTLVQVMAWCRQATSPYLSQCWPRTMSPYGITSPQWVKRTDETTIAADVHVPSGSRSSTDCVQSVTWQLT